VSEPFRVDNTPPTVGEFEVRRDGDGFRVRFVARDPGGRIAAVEYALDGRSWRGLDPEDGVSDSQEERYVLAVDGAALGESRATLVVRVTDAAGNLGGNMRAIGPGS
jgi:hypothetical protein